MMNQGRSWDTVYVLISMILIYVYVEVSFEISCHAGNFTRQNIKVQRLCPDGEHKFYNQ